MGPRDPPALGAWLCAARGGRYSCEASPLSGNQEAKATALKGGSRPRCHAPHRCSALEPLPA